MKLERITRRLARPVPLFPLHKIMLFPHGIAPLRVFEPRYRQLVTDATEGDRFIALATFEGTRWKQEYHGRPPLRPAVCIGQIIQRVHEAEERGVIIVQGLCRARIVHELPADGEKLYREAMLEPFGSEPDEESLATYRETFADALECEPLSDLRGAAALAEHLREPELPASAVLEIVTLSCVEDDEARYRILAEPDPTGRARMISRQLSELALLLRRATPQRQVACPKGCSWN